MTKSERKFKQMSFNPIKTVRNSRARSDKSGL